MSQEPLTYANAGVNIAAGNQLVDRIKPYAKSTMRPEVMGNLGGFGALCAIPKGYEEPILVSGTDGVGTKLKLALDIGKHDTIGIDLVAMCVNDLVVAGAEPLFFLDYYASGKLSVDTAADVIKGIADGCRQAGCSLVGGETAELPGLYQNDDYDLAGFCVGVVEKSKIIDGQNVQAGDQLIALGSSGTHSNGYSLIRRVIEQNSLNLNTTYFDNQGFNLGESLLEPTRIYVKTILELLKHHTIHALAHITGGGITENLPRVLPLGTSAEVNLSSWQISPLYQFLQHQGNIDQAEMLKTFNMGVGMVLVVPAEAAEAVCETARTLGETAWLLGSIKHQTNTAEPAGAQVEYTA